MTKTVTKAVGSDDLLFAQLACVKLAGLVEGTISVGLPALVTGVPEPRAFFDERFHVMNAFGLVLHTISGQAGGAHEMLQLREQSSHVIAALNDLRRLLGQSAPQRSLEPARLMIAGLCDAISEYGRLVMVDEASLIRMKAISLGTVDSLKTLNAPVAAAG